MTKTLTGETLYNSVKQRGLMSSLRMLIINPDYSAVLLLLSPNTCRDVFDERVFAHQRKNL